MRKVYLLSALVAALAIALTIAASVRGAASYGQLPGGVPGDAQPETAAPDVRTSPDPEPASSGARDSETEVRVLTGGAVRTMRLDAYLVGAVVGEMPASFETEALRAQAVAARTIVRRVMTVFPNPNHPDADVCTDPACCMAYTDDARMRLDWGSGYEANLEKIVNSVRSTDGVVATFGGEPILAVFHSSSAGKTEDSASVWGGELPYLVSVDSPDVPENNPKYTSTVTVTADEFRGTIMAAYPDAALTGGAEGWITDVAYTRGGRIAALTVGGAVVPGTHLRAMFGLGSTDAEISVTGDSVVFVTKGHGHGVGMSQYGANAMAAAGADYKTILLAYYTGITITD
jgi:stage II sporulation protein D